MANIPDPPSNFNYGIQDNLLKRNMTQFFAQKEFCQEVPLLVRLGGIRMQCLSFAHAVSFFSGTA